MTMNGAMVLDGKVALVTGGSRGSGRRSPCGWPRTAPTWW